MIDLIKLLYFIFLQIVCHCFVSASSRHIFKQPINSAHIAGSDIDTVQQNQAALAALGNPLVVVAYAQLSNCSTALVNAKIQEEIILKWVSTALRKIHHEIRNEDGGVSEILEQRDLDVTALEAQSQRLKIARVQMEVCSKRLAKLSESNTSALYNDIQKLEKILNTAEKQLICKLEIRRLIEKSRGILSQREKTRAEISDAYHEIQLCVEEIGRTSSAFQACNGELSTSSPNLQNDSTTQSLRSAVAEDDSSALADANRSQKFRDSIIELIYGDDSSGLFDEPSVVSDQSGGGAHRESIASISMPSWTGSGRTLTSDSSLKVDASVKTLTSKALSADDKWFENSRFQALFHLIWHTEIKEFDMPMVIHNLANKMSRYLKKEKTMTKTEVKEALNELNKNEAFLEKMKVKIIEEEHCEKSAKFLIENRIKPKIAKLIEKISHASPLPRRIQTAAFSRG